MEDRSSSDDEENSELGELETSRFSGDTTGELQGDMEMEVSGLEFEEPEDMETGVRGLEEPVEVPIKVKREVDLSEERKVKDFLLAGCGCCDSCWKKFEPAYLRAACWSCLPMS
uniref:Uncharacterized protein n=1 Tax=Amphimedon queenslandica TaxID=400682 RepID=A0A1X7VBL4_AMPQE